MESAHIRSLKKKQQLLYIKRCLNFYGLFIFSPTSSMLFLDSGKLYSNSNLFYPTENKNYFKNKYKSRENPLYLNS